MAASLFEHGAIRTTEAKAKELRPFVERLITTARKGTLHARKQVIARLRDRFMVDDEGEIQDKTVVQKLFDEIAPRYRTRPGGYTRIVRLAERRIGDAGVQVLLQLVEEKSTAKESAGGKGASRRKKRTAEKEQTGETAASDEAPAKGEAGGS